METALGEVKMETPMKESGNRVRHTDTESIFGSQETAMKDSFETILSMAVELSTLITEMSSKEST
jgi:hypothetical protein